MMKIYGLGKQHSGDAGAWEFKEEIMSANQDSAIKIFDSGFNCAQAVISVFCEKYGVDKDTAFKIAGGLGGGFRSGEVCGAVSGAVLVIGLKYGQCIAGDNETKANCSSKTRAFLKEFKTRHNSIICREILGCDPSTPEGLEEARSKNLFKTVCFDMVRSAISILEEQGY
jgi:C_GCAxxG_C_C family probable redox protein